MIVIVAPGQGSQTPGFLEPWLAEQRFAEQLAELSEAARLDLVAHGVHSDADTIRDTKIAQPLIVAAGLLSLGAVFADGRRAKVGGVAGHSVGEVTAAAAAGILTAHDAVAFVRERGSAMADAAALDRDRHVRRDRRRRGRRCSSDSTSSASSPRTSTAAGRSSSPARSTPSRALAEDPVPGTRVIPLQVAGAFHTRYMQPAVAHLEAFAAGLEAARPDPADLDQPRRHARRRAAQHSSTCSSARSPHRYGGIGRWSSLAEAGVTGIIELAPAGALVGLAKRGLQGVPSVAVKTPDDLPAAFAMIDGTAA